MEEESIKGEKGSGKRHSSNSNISEDIENMMNLDPTYKNLNVFSPKLLCWWKDRDQMYDNVEKGKSVGEIDLNFWQSWKGANQSFSLDQKRWNLNFSQPCRMKYFLPFHRWIKGETWILPQSWKVQSLTF